MTLYMHVIGPQDMPITPQAPPPAYVSDNGFGGYATTLTCLHPLTGEVTMGTTSQAYATSYGYGYPSKVEYDWASADGHPRLHPARGIWGNVSVDTGQPMLLHWYLRVGAGGETPADGPLAVPQVEVRVAIRAGEHISVDDEAYNSGRLLFAGSAGPASLANGEVRPDPAMQGEVRAAGQHGGAWVYEFIVPLTAPDPVLPFDDGYNVRIDTLLAVPGCDADADTTMMTGLAVGHSSDGMRPRIEWSVQDLMSAGHADLSVDEGGLLVTNLEASTVFGPDDTSNVTITLTRDGKPVPMRTETRQGYGACGHDCGHRTETVFVLDDPTVRPGVYNLTVSYDNLAGTAHRDLFATLAVEPEAESPGIGPAIAFALVALAAARRR